MKKILILNHNQEKFGTYWRCLNIGQRLAKKGFYLTMICASEKNFDLTITKRKISDNFYIITLPRIKYHKYYSGQILRMFITIFQVLFYKYDICYAFTVAQPQIAIPALIAKKIRRKKLLVDWDDFWGGGFADVHGVIIKTIFTFLERTIPKFADGLTYTSKLIGDKIDRFNIKTRKIQIPNGCNIKTIKPLDKIKSRKDFQLDLNKKYLITIGNTYTNSLKIMLQAFKKTISIRNDVYLIMIGAGEITPESKKLFNSLRHKIIFAGKKPLEDVVKYLSCADCLILPMDNNNIEKARFPIRFGDYLCAERPIVSNAVGEVKHYLNKFHAGLISPPSDYISMSDNILKALSDEKLSNGICLNARKLAKNELNWDNIIDKIIIYLKNENLIS